MILIGLINLFDNCSGLNMIGIIFFIVVGGTIIGWMIFFYFIFKFTFPPSEYIRQKYLMEEIDKRYYWHVERVIHHKNGDTTYVIRLNGRKPPESFLRKYYDLKH